MEHIRYIPCPTLEDLKKVDKALQKYGYKWFAGGERDEAWYAEIWGGYKEKFVIVYRADHLLTISSIRRMGNVKRMTLKELSTTKTLQKKILSPSQKLRIQMQKYWDKHQKAIHPDFEKRYIHKINSFTQQYEKMT